MTMLASQITSLTVVYSIVYSGVNQRKHQSSASLAFVREIHRGPVNFPHKWPVTRKMFPFDDVIMKWENAEVGNSSWSKPNQLGLTTWVLLMMLCLPPSLLHNQVKWRLEMMGNFLTTPYVPISFRSIIQNGNKYTRAFTTLILWSMWINSCGVFQQQALILIPEWINNYILYKVWDKINHPFPN